MLFAISNTCMNAVQKKKINTWKNYSNFVSRSETKMSIYFKII